MLRYKLGADLIYFVELLSTTPPYRLRELLIEELDRMPAPEREQSSVFDKSDEARIAELRAKYQSQPRPTTAGGFIIRRIGE